MKQYNIYIHREDSGIYKVIEAGLNLSNFDTNFRYYGTIEEGQCFYELIDDGSSDGDVIVNNLSNKDLIDGTPDNFNELAKKAAKSDFENFYTDSFSCSLVKRWVTPKGEVELETMYETTIYNEDKVDELINTLDNYSCRLNKEEDGTFDLFYEVDCDWGGLICTETDERGFFEEIHITKNDWGKIINEELADDDTFCWFEDLTGLSYDELIDVLDVLADNNTKLNEINRMNVQEWYDNHKD